MQNEGFGATESIPSWIGEELQVNEEARESMSHINDINGRKEESEAWLEAFVVQLAVEGHTE